MQVVSQQSYPALSMHMSTGGGIDMTNHVKIYQPTAPAASSASSRRKPVVTYRSPSAGTSDDSISITSPLNKPQAVRLVVTPSSTSTIASSASSMTLPPIRIRIPPHKDWYTMKPIPRAPLPLYHPLRVAKRPRPISTSTALPLVRKISPPANEEKGARPTRSRRPPLKLREAASANGGVPPSPTSSMAPEEVVEKSPEKKARRPRRKKAEILAEREAAAAAAAAAGGEDGVPQPPTTRRKRKRAGKDEEGGEEAAVEGEEELAVLNITPRKRRRRAGVAEEPERSTTPNNTSTYGTRSRTKGHKRTDSGASVAGSENDVDVVEDGVVTPTLEGEDDGAITPTRRKSPRSNPTPPPPAASQAIEMETVTQPGQVVDSSTTTGQDQVQEPL